MELKNIYILWNKKLKCRQVLRKVQKKEEGILLHCGWGPKEILEDSIVFKQCVSVKDKTGRFNPSYDEKCFWKLYNVVMY